MPSWAEFTQISLALTRIGAIMVPIMPIYRRDDVSYVLRNAGVRTAITCGPFRNFDYPACTRASGRTAGLRDLVWSARTAAAEDAITLETLFAGQTAGSDQLGPAAGRTIRRDRLQLGHHRPPKGCLHTFNTFGCGRGCWPGRSAIPPATSSSTRRRSRTPPG